VNVLSLFSGYGGESIVFNKLGINCDKVYASEISKDSISVHSKNFPNVTHVGDVQNWREWDIDWSSIDYLLAGSPCQGFSDAGKGNNFEDPRSKLFFEFVDIRDHILKVNPKLKWFLENVKMRKEWTNKISDILGVEPMRIDARLVSVCGRDRNYWFNWDAELPEDLGIKSWDIIDDEFKNPANIVGRRICPETGRRNDCDRSLPINQYLMSYDHGKVRCLTTVSKDCLLTKLDFGMYKDAYVNFKEGVDYRKPTIKELCQWHGIPEGYFRSASESKARRMIGNGWNIDVVSHIFSFL